MKEEDELLRKCGTKNPFTVPEGYFENFSKELMEKLPEKEISLSEPVITTWQRVKPWIYDSHVLRTHVECQSFCRTT